MRLVHASDLHDDSRLVSAIYHAPGEIVVLTGDLLDNYGRRPTINPKKEAAYQTEWLGYHAAAWKTAFRGRPVIIVPGNHDFINIKGVLVANGHDPALVHQLAAGSSVVLGGLRFAGFREIPYIEGEWAGEVHDFHGIIDRVWATNPDILVTHAPPAGVLDGRGYGIPTLTSALTYSPHNIKAHLFGHTHEHGGRELYDPDLKIEFFNGARCVRSICVGERTPAV